MTAIRTDEGREALIHHRKEACNECWGCVRYCPVKAIRVVAGHSEVIREKCVGCGLCVNECGRRGHVVRDDTPAVVELLRSRRPTIALLATEFIAALHPMTAQQVEKALETLGFAAVETTLLGEEIVAEEYEQLHAREDNLFSLRSTCPVVVEFVRKFYPALTPALAPVVPPYVAQARLIREVYPADAAIVYVSPCYARKDEALNEEFDGAVDVAIDFLELKRMIEGAADSPARGRATAPAIRRPSLLKEVSLTDGFPRQTLTSRDMTDVSVHVVRGLDELDRLLRAMMAGEAAPVIIDMLNCEGCIDGPAVNPGLSLYAKRNVETAARETPGTTHVSTRALLSVLPSVDTVRSFYPDPVALRRPDDADIDATLAEAGMARETVIDCGACGWATCVEHAVAVLRGDSTWDMCFPLQRSRLNEKERQLAGVDTLDPVTGLWNRRAFADRLDLELARHVRYGVAVSVVLVDLDAFAGVNELCGEEAGDAVLASLGERIASSLRATDLAARWTGDQYAVLLPGIGKTAAFAVAEKLREVVGATPVVVTSGGYTHKVSVTLSAGVATATPLTSDPLQLLEAADAALHDAMAAGGNQVRLAPG